MNPPPPLMDVHLRIFHLFRCFVRLCNTDICPECLEAVDEVYKRFKDPTIY